MTGLASAHRCGDCGWPSPLAIPPTAGAECDACGGALVEQATPRPTHWDAPNPRPLGQRVDITEARQPMAGEVVEVTRLGYLIRCADGVDRHRLAFEVYDPE